MVRVSVTAHTSNPHTRWAYGRADGRFLGWCEDHNLGLADVAPIDAGRFHTFRLALFKLQAVINTTTGQFHSDIDRYYAHSGVGGVGHGIIEVAAPRVARPFIWVFGKMF